MYVADVTDKDELLELLAEALDQLANSGCERAYEQAVWDIQDIEGRLEELGFKETPNKEV